jgi:hypothetical protein
VVASGDAWLIACSAASRIGPDGPLSSPISTGTPPVSSFSIARTAATERSSLSPAAMIYPRPHASMSSARQRVSRSALSGVSSGHLRRNLERGGLAGCEPHACTAAPRMCAFLCSMTSAHGPGPPVRRAASAMDQLRQLSHTEEEASAIV